jgi:hypothetical protein
MTFLPVLSHPLNSNVRPKENLLFTAKEFKSALESAMQQLQAVQKALEVVACPDVECLTVKLQDLTLERIEELIDEVPSGFRKADKGTDYVYVIRVPENCQNQVPTLVVQLAEARNLADDYCRINNENMNTGTLYVGRSKTLKARLRQHLGAENRGIYSMHLQRWATRNDTEISISYMKFENKEDLLVQAIEDGLWASLLPAFGRKGER